MSSDPNWSFRLKLPSKEKSFVEHHITHDDITEKYIQTPSSSLTDLIATLYPRQPPTSWPHLTPPQSCDNSIPSVQPCHVTPHSTGTTVVGVCDAAGTSCSMRWGKVLPLARMSWKCLIGRWYRSLPPRKQSWYTYSDCDDNNILKFFICLQLQKNRGSKR